MKRHNNIFTILLLVFLASCQGNYTPKPYGYVKVEYPKKEYVTFDEGGPYSFEYPVYARVIPSRSKNREPYWYDIYFPLYNGTIYLSYKPLNGNLDQFIEDSRNMVYKHAVKSDGIEEIPIVEPSKRHFGILYELEGDVASAIQFFLTDSTSNFIRGSLYLHSTPNRDSLNPVINFIGEDIEHLIETVKWN